MKKIDYLEVASGHYIPNDTILGIFSLSNSRINAMSKLLDKKSKLIKLDLDASSLILLKNGIGVMVETSAKELIERSKD